MSVDLLTVMELFMTPTAELADIVLPSATWLEADEVAAMPLIANNVDTCPTEGRSDRGMQTARGGLHRIGQEASTQGWPGLTGTGS